MSDLTMQTRLIHPDEASRLHRAYLRNPAGMATSKTKAIFYNFSILQGLIKDILDRKKELTESEISFGCYFGQYEDSDNPPSPNSPISGRNTIIIHFASSDLMGNISMINNEIYDFGDLKPPKIITGEQIQ